jgi:hypothetical protein
MLDPVLAANRQWMQSFPGRPPVRGASAVYHAPFASPALAA